MQGYYVTFVRNYIFKRSWKRAFNALSPDAAGLIIKALYRFVEGERDPERGLPEELKSIFCMMAEELEGSAENYCRKLRLADYEGEE